MIDANANAGGPERKTSLRKISRRRLLKLATAFGATSSFPAPAISQGLKKVTFLCSWSPEGSNFYAFLARERGYWKRRGLDVEVLRGSGSGMAVKAVGGNPDKFNFGMASSSTLTLEVAKGLPVTCLGMINYDGQMGVGVKATGPIKDVKQLANTTWGATPNSGEYPFLELFAKQAGFDFGTVKIQQVAGNVRETLLLRGEVDAVSASASSAIGVLQPQNCDIRFFLFRTVGINFYGQTLITQPERLKADPGLCEALTDGAMEAVKYTITNPEDTLEEMVKLHTDMTMTPAGKQSFAISLGIVLYFTASPEIRDHGIGYGDLARFQEGIDLVMKYVSSANDRRPLAEEIFTNRFVGAHKVSPAQLDACVKWTAPYSNSLV
jgi:ABC-type nitrate/sulfonate/bicarbonate transport system substrate-binding protein